MSDPHAPSQQDTAAARTQRLLADYQRIVDGFDRYKGVALEDQRDEALRTDNLEKFTAVLQEVEGEPNFSYIHVAVKAGSLRIVRYLHEYGVEINQGLLDDAACAGHTEVAAYLYKYVSKKDALMTALAYGHHDIIKKLHPDGAILEDIRSHVFEKICRRGDIATLEYIRQNGGEALFQHHLHECFVHALEGNQPDMLAYLHRHFPQNFSYDEKVLLISARKGYVETLDYLCTHFHWKPDILGRALETSIRNDRLDSVHRLERIGAKLDFCESFLFKEAASYGRLEMLQHLYRRYPETAGYLSDALCPAVGSKRADVLTYLISCGADPSYKEHDALRSAIIHKDLALVKVLSDYTVPKRCPALALSNPPLDILSYLKKKGISCDLPAVAQYDTRALHWEKTVRLSPPVGIEEENPALFKKSAFDVACLLLQQELQSAEMVNKLAFQAAALFQTPDRILQYLKKWGIHGQQPLHDLLHAIQVPQSGPFNAKDWGDAVLKCGPSMAKLVKFADKIPTPAKSTDGRTWSMLNTRAECAKHAFNNAAAHPDLAKLCFDHDQTERIFDAALKTVLRAKPHVKNMPDIRIDGSAFDMPGATFKRLDSGDIRGLFLGAMTDCCQSLGGHGDACARHGYFSQNGGFYVIEKANGKIVGQAWAWRGTNDELCLDSLETLKGHVSAQQWEKILTAFADHLAAENTHNITALHIGTGGNTPKAHLGTVFRETAEAIPFDYNNYRDSDEAQIVAWKKTAPHF